MSSLSVFLMSSAAVAVPSSIGKVESKESSRLLSVSASGKITPGVGDEGLGDEDGGGSKADAEAEELDELDELIGGRCVVGDGCRGVSSSSNLTRLTTLGDCVDKSRLAPCGIVVVGLVSDGRVGRCLRRWI